MDGVHFHPLGADEGGDKEGHATPEMPGTDGWGAEVLGGAQ